MLRKFILSGISAAMFLCSSTLVAKDRTTIETFIMSVKETNTFVPVNDIWAPDNNFDQTELLKDYKRAQNLTIDFAHVARVMKEKNFAINLTIPGFDGNVYDLELAHHRILTNDFELHAVGNGKDTKVDYTPGLYYRGVVKGIPGSMAAFSFFNNEVYGIISIPGEGNITIVPYTMVVDGKEVDYNPHYLLYRDSDIRNPEKLPSCHSEELSDDHLYRTANKTTTTLNNKVYTHYSCKQVNFFLVADYSMFQKKTSVTNCTNYFTSLFNNIGLLYLNEGIMIGIKYVQVNTATDEYQSLSLSSSTWLSKFGQVTQNTMHGADLAQLHTTKGGSMGGIAWLRVLCNSYGGAPQHAGPYSFVNITNSATTTTPYPFNSPYYSWDVEASTHEIGHNLGSPHTHACAWGPSRNTAIDGCQTTEGSCPNPGVPGSSVKGTIMSYCHLVSSGISFNNGFGPQPGDTIRYFVRNASCPDIYKPNFANAKANTTVTANRECTDVTSGITYYWKSPNTVANTDDTLVLMVKKNGNSIGDLNTTGFAVTATTLTGMGGGTAPVVTFPAGTAGIASGANNYAVRRYWKITHTGAATLASDVDVYFPLIGSDTTDVNGSAPGITAPFNNFRMYSVKKPTINPDPTGGFTGATAADITVHTKGTSPSTTNWVNVSSGTGGNSMLAMFKTKTLHGGGAFYPHGLVSVDNVITNGGVDIFPNPTTNEWYIALKENFGTEVSFQLFSADGRVLITQTLQSNTVNTINAANLPTGMYFYRIVGGSNVTTGNLLKN